MIKNIDSLLGEMRKFAKEQHIPISNPESIETITQLLLQQQPKYCLEIGTCIGFGTIEIARRIAERGGHITSYEISTPSFALAQAYIKQSGLSNITLKFENILDTSKKQVGSNKYSFDSGISNFDFIYIDGQKSKYLDFLFLVLPYCSPKSIILFDDVLAFPYKTQEFWNWIEINKIPHQLIKHQDGDGMLILEVQNFSFGITNCCEL